MNEKVWLLWCAPGKLATEEDKRRYGVEHLGVFADLEAGKLYAKKLIEEVGDKIRPEEWIELDSQWYADTDESWRYSLVLLEVNPNWEPRKEERHRRRES
jgi:hypothetical protein